MKFKFLFFTFLLFCLFLKPTFAQEWKELKGDHFIIYYQTDDAFTKEVLRKAEGYYKDIGEDLGYARASNFWQWENRVKIYIYPTQKDFIAATGRKEWSHGVADYDTKTISSYIWNEGFIEALLPHEIGHLVFRDYVGFEGEVPLWLDEGVAQWQEPAKRAIVKDVMKSALAGGKSFTIKNLTEMDVRTISDAAAVQLFYVQAMSVIDFLIKRGGSDAFIYFCRQLRDGKSLDEALKFAYPTSIRNLTELEEQWKGYVIS